MEIYDEISLASWEKLKIKGADSKSFYYVHNGFRYGDLMKGHDCVAFVYAKNGEVAVFNGESRKEKGPKFAYFEMVQKACTDSKETLNNFLKNESEKFRIYSKNEVSKFDKKKRSSTRIKDDSCLIDVNGQQYYVAHNLKVCEYFNSAAMNISEKERSFQRFS